MVRSDELLSPLAAGCRSITDDVTEWHHYDYCRPTVPVSALAMSGNFQALSKKACVGP
jgi:hypothetical protein